jgi:hypothetical protein
MKFYPKITYVLHQLLIPISVISILLAGLQVKHFSSFDQNSDTLQEVTIAIKDVAILPFVIKTFSGDYYALPEVLFFKTKFLIFLTHVAQSIFENTYSLNVYFVFTCIHAP